MPDWGTEGAVGYDVAESPRGYSGVGLHGCPLDVLLLSRGMKIARGAV